MFEKIIYASIYVKNLRFKGHLVAQLVKSPAVDFGSGHDLLVCKLDPCVRLCTLTDSAEPAWDFSPSLSAPPLLVLAVCVCLSLSQNK